MSKLTEAVDGLSKASTGLSDAGGLGVVATVAGGVGLFFGFSPELNGPTFAPTPIWFVVSFVLLAVGFFVIYLSIKALKVEIAAAASREKAFQEFLEAHGVEASDEAVKTLALPERLPTTSKLFGTAEVLYRGSLTKIVLKYEVAEGGTGDFILLSAAGVPLEKLPIVTTV